jgi:hypothetical protein
MTSNNDSNFPRISPSRIGGFSNPDACPRCLYLLLRMRNKKPFDFGVPAIMHTLDRFQKLIPISALSENNALPAFYGRFKDAVEVLPIEEFTCTHAETGLVLYGKPDIVLRRRSNGIVINDNKTSQPKEPESPLGRQYSLQLNLYGYTAEHCEWPKKVEGLGLLYFTAPELGLDDIEGLYSDDGVTFPLNPRLVEVDYDPPTVLFPVLRRVREMLELDSPPAGTEGCRDCRLLDEYNSVLQLTQTDAAPPWLTHRELARFQAKQKFLRTVDHSEELERAKRALLLGAKPHGALRMWLDLNSH